MQFRQLRAAAAVGLCGLMASCSRPSIEEAPTPFARKAEPDEIERQMARDADDIWNVVAKTLKDGGLAIVQQDHDKLGGDLTAQRAGGGNVFVRVRQLQPRQSSITVRLQPPDRRTAFQLHEAFARGLGLGEAKSGLFGGESDSGSYRVTLDQAVQAARDALAAAKLEVTDATHQAEAAEVKGRRGDSIPAKIQIKSKDGRTASVTFIAGTEKNEEIKMLVRTLKQEFERRVRERAP